MSLDRVTVSVPAKVQALAELTRIGTVVVGACLCLIGARLATGSFDGQRVAWATACVVLLIGFAQVANDIIDIEVDRLQGRSRPLVRGALSTSTATALAVVLGAAGLLAGFAGGRVVFSVAIVILLASWAYSVSWKGSVMFGNVVVAFLASCPIVFGAFAAGNPDGRVWASFAVVFVFMLAFEVLKTGRDIVGDRAAGLSTLATRFGLRTTYRVSGAICVGFAGVSIIPAFLSDNWPAYVAVMTVAVALTEAAAMRLLRSSGAPGDLGPAFGLLRAAWFPGIAALVLL